jgi:hypothetical protein
MAIRPAGQPQRVFAFLPNKIKGIASYRVDPIIPTRDSPLADFRSKRALNRQKALNRVTHPKRVTRLSTQ